MSPRRIDLAGRNLSAIKVSGHRNQVAESSLLRGKSQMKTVRQLRLSQPCESKTKHMIGGESVQLTASLQIVQFEGDDAFYLLRLDVDGNELTDTFHESLQSAYVQADFEYGVQEADWKAALN